MSDRLDSMSNDDWKKEWSVSEIESAKDDIDACFAVNADWDHSVRDMGLAYRAQGDPAGLYVSGDFYMEQRIRIVSFVRTQSGRLILVGEDDEQCRPVYYEISRRQ